MMMSRYVTVLLSLFFWAAGISPGASFIHAGMQLSNNAVLSMYQDPDGMIWVGTYDGLHLYNGKDTYVYRMDLDSGNTLCSNTIVKIVPAGKDYMWLATSLGINRFSIKERRVCGSYPLYAEVDNIVADDAGNTLLFFRKDFVSCYNPETDLFEDIYMPGVEPGGIVSLWSDRTGNFCILGKNGRIDRYRFSSQNMELSHVSTVKVSEKEVRKASRGTTRLYFSDIDGRLWKTSFDGQLVEKVADLSAAGVAGYQVSAICEYGDYIYFGSFGGGFFRLPVRGGDIENLAGDYRVFCIIGDLHQDIVWVGTDGYGVYMFCRKPDIFSEIIMSDLPQRIMKPVRAICTDREGDLWIGTKGDGIVRISDYDRFGGGGQIQEDNIVRYTRESGLPAMEVFGFCPDTENGILWIGSAGPGLAYYSYEEDMIVTVRDGNIRNVHQMRTRGDSLLYLACDMDALVELQYHMDGTRVQVDSVRRYRFRHGSRDCNDFYALSVESDSTILLGIRGGYGLIRFNTYTGTYSFVNPGSFTEHAVGDILCVHKSDISGIYCGSGSGFIRIFPDGTVRNYGDYDGLLNNMVHGILEDADGSIWLSTNQGLSQYNPNNEFFHNWSSSDLDVTEFSDDAYGKCQYTGRLFFGGVNGVAWVSPQPDTDPGYRPPLLFLDLAYPDGTVPLSGYNGKASEDVHPVIIKRGVSRFTVSFIAVDYLNGSNYEYSYRLDGAGEEEWTGLRKDNKVTLNNLPAGRYRLQVRYKSNVSGAPADIFELPLRVPAPWYGSIFAVICYVFTGAAALIYGFLYTRRYYHRKQAAAMARMEEEQSRKLYEARLNFFVNISHELCTPLTLINGMAERISQQAKDEQMIRYSEILSMNVKGLNELVQEILDFRQIEEEGFGRVNIRSTDVGQMLKAQMKSFDDVARRNGIQLQLIVPPVLVWHTDRAFLKKIVFNLFSNALKYTPADGTVKMEAFIEDGSLVLKIMNTGKGIPAEQLERIFDKYKVLDDMDSNIYTDTASRHGLGLFICSELVKAMNGTIKVVSEVDRMTEFTVVLPFRELTGGADDVPSVAGKEHVTGGRHLIMVVEDNKEISWLISSALSGSYDIVSCSNADEASARLDELTPDLIITDILMPGRSGLDFISSIRNDRYRKGIPVIIVSAKVSEKEQAEGLACGADIYLTKPFSISVLQASVSRLLESRKTLKDFFSSPESAYSSVDGHLVHQSDKEFMQSVLEILPKHITDEAFSMESLASDLGMTARGFYRKFKKISGKTPSEFIKDYRFEMAASLLKSTGLTVQEIMYKVGISNKSYFYREFVSKYGMKPREYRQVH